MRGDAPLASLDRRGVLGGGLSAAVLPGCVYRAESPPLTEIVLIHGAWHGGWCWDLVRPLLESAGLTVHAPTLPGLAERAGELRAGLGLADHVADARAYAEQHVSGPFVLVGHSYGGMVVTALADALKSRIAHVVYLDAAVPRDGESMVSYGAPRSAETIAASVAALRQLAPDGVAMAPLPPALLGIPEDHPRHDWVAQRLTAHPLKTWLDPVALAHGGAQDLPRTYIHCTDPVLPQTQFPWLAERARTDPSWRYAKLATGHEAMITDPEGVAMQIIAAMMAAKTMEARA